MTTMKTGRAGTAALLFGLAAAVIGGPGPAGAQEQQEIEDLDLPRHVADGVVEFFNDPSTIRFNGRSGVPAQGEIVGDVGVLGGPFTVAGRIRGDLVVLNGDLRFQSGGAIEGDVMVIGGRIVRLDGAEPVISGAVTVYEEALRYRERGGRISVREHDTDEAPGLRWGGARLTVRAAGSYNRVEGLPVLFGPTFRTAEPDPFRFEALGLWRTESGFALDEAELGYVVRAEQEIGRQPVFGFGASAYSRISPIAEWGLTSLESSLSTFFLHHDFRDHFEQEGWSVWARMEDRRWPVALRLEYRDEEHAFAPVSSPWTLRKNDEPWRSQPLVAEGDLRTVTGEVTWDDRNDPEDPSDGWYGTLRVTRGLDGDLALPAVGLVSGPGTVGPTPVDHDFTAGLVDLRRYNRVTPAAQLSFRLVYGGSLDGRPVPSQFQQALGGEGSLPGYRLFAADCGARREIFLIERRGFDEEDPLEEPVFPRYGCDRALLFQLEYRSSFDFSIDLGPDDEDDWDRDWDWYPVVDLSPSWAFFFDAGRGWSESDSSLDTGTVADVGLGLFLGDIGIYWAYPLEGDDRDVNFFIRLERRF